MVDEISHKNKQNFLIECLIGDEPENDYTSNLQRIRIVSSLASMYPVVVLEFLVEGETIINRNIFGKDDIKINITQVFEDNVIGEEIDMNLVYIKSSGIALKNRSIKPMEIDADSTGTDVFSVSCLLKEPLEDLSLLVNRLFDSANENNTPTSAIQTVIDEFLPYMNTNINTQDANLSTLPRTFNCPQMSFADFIRFIDNSQKIYYSPCMAFYGIDRDVGFSLFSTKYAINQSPSYNIHLLPADDINDILEQTSNSNEHFYTRIPIRTTNNEPSNVLKIGGNHSIRVDPNDYLYTQYDTTANDVIKDYTARTGDLDGSNIHQSLKNITKFSGHSFGAMDHDSYLSQTLSSYINFNSQIIIGLSRNLSITKLINPGVCMNLETYSEDYIEYGGHYITAASDIEYSRVDSEIYSCTCKLRCVRGNIKEL